MSSTAIAAILPSRGSRAARQLGECRMLLGQRGWALVVAVAAEGKALGDISRDKRDRRTLADNLRAALDDLAGLWGMQTGRRRQSEGHPETTRFSLHGSVTK